MEIEEILRRLTPLQRDAVLDRSREVRCLACAGSGKSLTLAYRIARLIAEGTEPSSIVAFTFTKKAAESLQRRVASALEAADQPATVLGQVYIGTIDSYCQSVLSEMDARYRQFDVLDENRLKLFLISRRTDLGLDGLMEARNAPFFEVIRELSEAWKITNDQMLSIDDIAARDRVLGGALSALYETLQRDRFLDFSLTIRFLVEALQRDDEAARQAVAGLKHLMVDEYQDVNTSQEALITLLNRGCETLFVVGDDDQSIFGWRGADVRNIVAFAQRYPGCGQHTLSVNFRSTPAIVRTADEFAAAELGPLRIVKNPTAANEPVPRDFRNLWFDSRPAEAEWVVSRITDLLGTEYRERDGRVRGLTPSDFAILMRSTGNNSYDRTPRHLPFTQALESRRIDYAIQSTGGIFNRPQVQVLRDTFELLRDRTPDRNIALNHFERRVQPFFRFANFDRLADVLAAWGRRIHAGIEGARRRIYPQQLVHDLLNAFGVEEMVNDPNYEAVMRELGVFSRIIQDVETVYLSVDTKGRFRQILNFLQNVAETGYDIQTDAILLQPDVVTVSTVHRAKGLEFPVVFVVDVETQRFPRNRQRYTGWLPISLLQPALDRSCYQTSDAEEARLFYTALTRAERYLYITGSETLPPKTTRRKRSKFSLRLSNPEMSTASDGLPNGLRRSPPIRRIDEDTTIPTSYSEIKYFLSCPNDYRFRKVFGFAPPITDLFGFGRTVHAAIGRLHQVFANDIPTSRDAETIANDVFHLKHVPQSANPVNNPGPYERARASAVTLVRSYGATFGEDFSRRRQVEVAFDVPIQGAVISGSIDLMLQEDEEGRILDASVIDFKTMKADDDPTRDPEIEWTELALQVQLYAMAARDVLGENARTGAVHFLRKNSRVYVPVSDEAVAAAVANVEWAVNRIIAGDFPMRPSSTKCAACDFRALCPKTPQQFAVNETPPPMYVPESAGGRQMARAFSQFEP